MSNQSQSSGGITAGAVTYTYKATFTAAQVKTIFSAPITLIAAAGVNKIIAVDPLSICFKGSSTGANFNFNNADNIQIGAQGTTVFGTMTAIEFNTGAVLIQPTAMFQFSTGFAVSGGEITTGVANQPVQLYASIADATLGGKTVTITFNYSIMDVS